MQAQLFGKLVLWINTPSKMLSLPALFSKVRWSHMIGSSLAWSRNWDPFSKMYYTLQFKRYGLKKQKWNEMKVTGDKHFHIGNIILLQITYMRCVIASAESLFFTKCQWNQNCHRLVHKYILKLSTPYKPILLASGRYLLYLGATSSIVFRWALAEN